MQQKNHSLTLPAAAPYQPWRHSLYITPRRFTRFVLLQPNRAVLWGHANHRGHNSCMHVIACVLKWRHIVSAINAHAYDHHYSQGESPLSSCPVLNRGHLSIIHFNPSSKTVWILLIWTNFLLYSWTYRDPVPLTFRVMGDRGSKHTILRSYLV